MPINPINPLTLSPKLWLKADAIVGLNDGDPVSSWADSSGNGHDATEATTTAQPIYKVNILNGYPAIRFDGVDDTLRLSGTGLNISKGAPAITIITVAKQTNSAVAAQVLYRESVNSTVSNTRIQSGISSNSRLLLGSRPTDAGSFQSFVSGNDVAPVTYALYNYTIPSSGLGDISVNGITKLSPTVTGSAATFEDLSAASASIGAIAAATTIGVLNGDIVELLVFNTPLSLADRQGVEVYLAWKYNLALGYYTPSPYQVLATGSPQSLYQNVVYILPCRLVMLHSKDTVEVSNNSTTGFISLTSSTTGQETSATYIRCTTADTIVTLKASDNW